MSADADPFAVFEAPPENPNVGCDLRRRAQANPHAVAVRIPAKRNSWRDISFSGLESESDALAQTLAQKGVCPGDRVCVFVRSGIELIATTYALFKLGAIPVLIDPGMGRKSFLQCVEHIKPRAMVGIRAAMIARLIYRRAFRSVKIAFTVPRAGKLTHKFEDTAPFDIYKPELEEEAAILFTSGSTGPAKGVRYTHGNFRAQIEALGALYDFKPGEVDVVCFPLFALFDTALGMTSVFPVIDPSHPARCDPAQIVRAIVENNATLTFGSPAIWMRVVPWLLEEQRSLPSLKRVLIAGAPVPPKLVEGFHQVLTGDADVFTPYGATEALPVASLSGREILERRSAAESGAGTCVGHLAPGIDCRLIRITDEPIQVWSDDLLVESGTEGEIVVRGPVVTRSYKFEAEHDALAKIPNDDHVWHRMGDIGRFDDEGRLWFCGRKSHRLQTDGGTVLPVPQENIFNTHPGVKRSALVGVGESGAEVPVLVVEPFGSPSDALAREISNHCSGLTDRIQPVRVLFKSSFPVDVRHNAKIHRGELKAWATSRLR
ncbi:MAG: acyl-CoA synthetase (AMP-forming)/AMP-acid ligase II [Planctomycetota bacterium]